MKADASVLAGSLERPERSKGRLPWAALSGCLLLTASALAGSPRVASIHPAGTQRGSEVEVECRGSNLEDARSILFDEPGFEATVVSAEKTKVKLKLKVTAEARLGEHRFRVITASGVADLRLFYVSPFPVIAEVEPKEGTNTPQPIALGTTVYGKTPAENQDRFEVELKKGQRLSAEVIGVRLQSGAQIYDSLLTVSKADGTQLILVDDSAFTRQDPVASIIAPEDGKYIVAIREATNAGQGDCQYLLNIGSFARPLAVYPPGGQVGTELKYTFLGDASGPLERTVRLPDQPQDRFELFCEDTQPSPQPNVIRVSPFPNVLEVEPNNDATQAPLTAQAPPFAFNGILQEAGDFDTLKFVAKKDQEYDLQVYGRRLRSPIDSVLSIADAKGKQIASNDDSGFPDSYLRWKAPADGEFVIGVRDQLGRGGPTYTYRVEVTAPEPRVSLALPEMVQNSNQERRAISVPKNNRYATLVRVKKADVGGDLQLSASDLPAGVAISGDFIDKSTDSVPVVFEAGAEAVPGARYFKLEAKSSERPEAKSRVAQDIDVAENGNQASYYSVVEDKLVAAVTDEIPVKLNLVAPKGPVLQGGSLNLQVVAERSGDFKGPIALALLYSPPGIGTAGTAQIAEGKNDFSIPVSANADAPLKKWRVCVVGSADFGKGTVWMSTPLVELEVAPPMLTGKIQRSFVDQGDSTTVTVKLENPVPFEGKAKLTLLGLPANTTAEPQEVTKDDKEVRFVVKAAKDAPAATHKQLFCQFQLTKNGEPLTSTFAQGGILRIDKTK